MRNVRNVVRVMVLVLAALSFSGCVMAYRRPDVWRGGWHEHYPVYVVR